MISTTRLIHPRANISATTAMEAIAPQGGRTEAIRCGANVVMPVITPPDKKKQYYLYEGKSSVSSTLNTLQHQITAAGRRMDLLVHGDPRVFEDR